MINKQRSSATSSYYCGLLAKKKVVLMTSVDACPNAACMRSRFQPVHVIHASERSLASCLNGNWSPALSPLFSEHHLFRGRRRSKPFMGPHLAQPCGHRPPVPSEAAPASWPVQAVSGKSRRRPNPVSSLPVFLSWMMEQCSKYHIQIPCTEGMCGCGHQEYQEHGKPSYTQREVLAVMQKGMTAEPIEPSVRIWGTA